MNLRNRIFRLADRLRELRPPIERRDGPAGVEIFPPGHSPAAVAHPRATASERALAETVAAMDATIPSPPGHVDEANTLTLF